jgi:hypothetical protein
MLDASTGRSGYSSISFVRFADSQFLVVRVVVLVVIVILVIIIVVEDIGVIVIFLVIVQDGLQLHRVNLRDLELHAAFGTNHYFTLFDFLFVQVDIRFALRAFDQESFLLPELPA